MAQAHSEQPQSQQTNQAGHQPDSRLAQVMQRLQQQGMVPLMVAGAGVIALVVALFLWASSPDYRVLFSNVSEQDGGQIVSTLESQGVNYRLTGDGTTIMVPANQVHRLRLQLAEAGLPHGGNTGFAIMDDQSFGISQFAEQVNFQRALEGELSSSVESMGPVARARVHLAMAKQSVFVRDQEPAKASVVVNLHAGRSLSQGQVQSVVHLVSSSVSELSPEHVTVVDQRGNLLSQTDDEMGGLSGSELDYTQQIEHNFQQRIESILSPILGQDNVRATVTAQLDFSSREETIETYAPNQTPETAAVRSIQHNLSSQGGDHLNQGIPGALSNTPPGVVPSPITVPEPDLDEQDAAEGPLADEQDPAAEPVADQQAGVRQAGNGSWTQDNIVNYEVDRNIAHIQHQRGRLDRLSVAVVVNHRYETDEEGNPTAVPLEPEEIDYIERLVQQSVGFNPERGDAIEVINSQFVIGEEDDPIAELEWWQDPELQQLLLPLARYILAGIGALLLYFLLLRPFIKRATRVTAASDEESASAATGGSKGRKGQNLSVAAGDEDDVDDELEAERQAANARYQKAQRQADAYEQELTNIRDLALSKPRLAAMVLQNWMNQDAQEKDR